MYVRMGILLTSAFIVLNSVAFPKEFPSSERSRAVIARVQPSLEAALRVKGLQMGAPIFIRIFKESSELELWVESERQFELFKIYDICTFSGHLGPKLREGDQQSPEGFYFVTPERLNPASQFHLSFNLGYPNAYDQHYGRTGSALMVHGDCVSIGCYAMTDAGIEEIYALADAAFRQGQPLFRVHLFPFRMTEDTIQEYQDSNWYPFWQNLKEGYEFFERVGQPPNVEVQNKRYVFSDP